MEENIPTADKQPQVPHKSTRRLNLPFSKRKRDVGAWIYDHRAGVSVTIIAYLLIAIIFVGSKVVVKAPESAAGIILDMRTLEELQKEKQRLEREVQMRQQQSSDADNTHIRNIISNENAELRDDRNTNMSSIRDRAENLNSKMQSNRDTWEKGMQEIASMHNNKDDSEGGEKDDARIKGRITVSFSLVNPLRHSGNLVVPAYRCEKGGEVVVNITVNRSGDVIAASIDRSLSDNDNCMHETALDAAKHSHFNLDATAPDRQTGTITYLFIPQ